ncbi:hypothetical protein [Herbaspirillum seropedicae]|uniref:hypothetical protein n=1 Tax=Herbaspirillum seropedicae TaxID=964 RepID=UPI00285F7D33|nr:hypothetical protein [Herbaspirillum seropedicae]MDR6397552.1 hypothetical protein [Herbaspirillum seropedicae]
MTIQVVVSQNDDKVVRAGQAQESRRIGMLMRIRPACRAPSPLNQNKLFSNLVKALLPGVDIVETFSQVSGPFDAGRRQQYRQLRVGQLLPDGLRRRQPGLRRRVAPAPEKKPVTVALGGKFSPRRATMAVLPAQRDRVGSGVSFI